MENILQGLHEIEGVHGAIVLDASGQIVAHRTHSVYDIDLLQQVGRAITGAIDAVKLVQEDWESITTHFSEGKLSSMATMRSSTSSRPSRGAPRPSSRATPESPRTW